MARRRRSAPTGLGDLVFRWVRRNHFDDPMLACSLQLRWPELVGARLGTRTRPQSFETGLLTIAVANSAWLNELTFLKDELRTRLNAQLPGAPIKGLRLVVGRLLPAVSPGRRRAAKPLQRRPSAARRAAALERAQAELAPQAPGDDEVVAAIRRARAAQLAREGDED